MQWVRTDALDQIDQLELNMKKLEAEVTWKMEKHEAEFSLREGYLGFLYTTS